VYKNQFNHHTYQAKHVETVHLQKQAQQPNHELTTLSGPCSGTIFCHVINAAHAHIFLSWGYVTALGNAATLPALSASSYKIPLFD